jgi:deazaflavin-dependent oxidoreductase (nitroreductase family)
MSNEDLFGDEHVRVYRETNGERGYFWKRESTILLLTTTGRKSGEPRTMPLIFTYDGDDLVIVASQGGKDEHPAWYLNLRANPEAEVQVRGDVFKVRARDAEGEERERLWRQMAEAWPNYDAYQKRTDRRIPVVVLERV